jgi:hypothetical protein
MKTNYFDEINTAEKSYWLGFITADGSVTYNTVKGIYRLSIGLQKDDANHIAQLEKDLGGTRTPYIEKTVYSPTHFQARLHWYSKSMVQKLIHLGILPRKSYLEEMNLPLFPQKFERDFWRGLFDGDGCISIQQKKKHLLPEYRFSLAGHKNLLEAFQNWGNKITNMKYQKIIRAKNQHGESGTFVFYMNGNRQIAATLNAMYDNSTRYLNRKYDLYLSLLKQNEFCGNKNVAKKYTNLHPS